MQKKVAVLIGLTLVGSFLLYIIYYGFSFNFPPCIYTEEDVVIPQELSGVTLVGEKYASIYTGDDGEELACTKILGSIEKFIVNGSDAAYVLHYGAKEQRTIKDMRFTLKQIVKTTKHGVSAIEGSGTIDWLVLEDENGIRYRLNVPSLGVSAEESFLGVWKDDQRKGRLVREYYPGTVSIDSDQQK